MDIRNAFPSKYLKASDLQGREVNVIINRVVDSEEVGQDQHKPVVYFKDKEKGLVLNKTNSNIIQQLYGHETDDWRGKDIVLYPTVVDFRGTPADTIRVRGSKGRSGQNTAPPKSVRPIASTDLEMTFRSSGT